MGPPSQNRFLTKISLESPDHGCKWEAVFNTWIKKGEDKAQTRPFALISGVPPTGPPPAPQPPAQTLPVAVRPGDPGVHPEVLGPDAFSKLPAMQAGAPDANRRDQSLPEPKCDWQQYTVPYPQDPRYQLTYYNNAKTGQSTYDKPPEFARWEAQHAEWVASTLSGHT